MQRRSIFISHANPGDNDFALWLATRLGFLGYRTWVDVEKLKGGETIWQVVQKEIREETILFLFIVSNASVVSEGARRELSYAQTVSKTLGLADFVVPMKLQPVAHADALIEVSGTYYISATENWADALEKLLTKLRSLPIQPDQKIERPHARQRLLTLVRPTQEILERPETLLSNWFRVDASALQLSIYDARQVVLRHAISEPYFRYCGDHLVHLGRARQSLLDQGYKLVGSTEIQYIGNFTRTVDVLTISRFVSEWMSKGLQEVCARRGLAEYFQSGGKFCAIFTKSTLEDQWLRIDGSAGFRCKVWGKRRDHFWHFGVSPRVMLGQDCLVSLVPVVLFTDDGLTFWDKPARHGREAVRATAKWYNDRWRRLVAATSHWLADRETAINVPLGPECRYQILSHPVEFSTDHSYLPPDSDISEDEEVSTEEDEFVETDESDGDEDQEADDDDFA